MTNTKVDTAAKEATESKEHGVEPTKVKVRFTVIKFFNEETNEVSEVRLIGKMGLVDCKRHVQSINKANVFISKTNDDDEFSVDTIALHALKQA